MPPASADTIVAVATPPGRGGVGVVRVSGPLAVDLCKSVCGVLPEPRRAVHRAFVDGDGRTLDEGLVLRFAAPASYTGEDVVEFQGHGSPPALSALVQRCVALGARIARPGEFTERAFLHDRLDLAQAEAVADLIDASSEQAARAAMRSLSGEFSRTITGFEQAFEDLRVLIEAAIDFPEEDVEVIERYQVRTRLTDLLGSMDRVLAEASRGQRLREGAIVVLIGAPNVGKSSLLNRLAGEELAIVTPVPGTTRDPIRAPITLDGVPLLLVDTAGLRASEDLVEQEGIARSKGHARRADLALVVTDGTTTVEAAIAEFGADVPLPDRRIVVRNKIDLTSEPGEVLIVGDHKEVRVSAATGEGLDLLRREVLSAIGWEAGEGESVFLARARHLSALSRAREHLEAALTLVGVQVDLVAEELRYGREALGEILGRKSADALLGDIFSRFCIGK